MIDIYCERTEAAFWAEPINALTNAAFLLAAIIVFVRLRQKGALEPGAMVLLAILAAIGVGSFLFHTFATRWAALADTLPILLFILAYLALTLRRAFGLSWLLSGALTMAFVPASAGIGFLGREALGGFLGSSTGYLPAFLALLVSGGILAAREHSAGRALLLGAGLFAISLTFRTLDEPLCDLIPLGTHFLWHICNAALLGFLIHSLPQKP
jgi:hypothetical protein